MKKPSISTHAFIAEGAIVRGDVTISDDCSIWFHTTIRAEKASIFIGSSSNIQDNAVLHVDAGYPVSIGSYVTVGHSAIVHGCTIGDNTLIGMGATILNGANIGKNCIIGANALVPQNMTIPDHSLVVGVPGRILRKTTPEEIASNRANALSYVKEASDYQNEDL
ncbi:MAG: gamma carbonic anhydrase family protein [Lachnospiraceae bacterium]|nr:gamma carbonic anhydrase family protein [Lachnospiraceae bacterium]